MPLPLNNPIKRERPIGIHFLDRLLSVSVDSAHPQGPEAGYPGWLILTPAGCSGTGWIPFRTISAISAPAAATPVAALQARENPSMCQLAGGHCSASPSEYPGLHPALTCPPLGF